MIYIYDTIPFIQKKLIGQYHDGFVADEISYRLWDSNYLISSFLNCSNQLYCVINPQYQKLVPSNMHALVEPIKHGSETLLDYATSQVKEDQQVSNFINYHQINKLNQAIIDKLTENDILIFNTCDLNVDKQDALWIACMLQQVDAIKIGYIEERYAAIIDFSELDVLIIKGSLEEVKQKMAKYSHINCIVGIINSYETLVKIQNQYYKVFSSFYHDDKIIIESVIASIADSLAANASVYTLLENTVAYNIVAANTNAEHISIDAIDKAKEKIQIKQIGGLDD